MAEWTSGTGEIVFQRRLSPDVARMGIRIDPRDAARFQPGQFYMVRTWEGEPLLPRAMAPIAVQAEGLVDIVYRVVGEGTRHMWDSPVGGACHLIGPLGRPFAPTGGSVALVGRGVGITPLLPIARQVHGRGGRVLTYLSARTPGLLLDIEAFRALGDLQLHTDAQAPGRLVTESLLQRVRSGERIDTVVVAGSRRLRQEVARLAAQDGLAAWEFVEEKMACGTGFCKGCAVGSRLDLLCQVGPAIPVQVGS